MGQRKAAVGGACEPDSRCCRVQVHDAAIQAAAKVSSLRPLPPAACTLEACPLRDQMDRLLWTASRTPYPAVPVAARCTLRPGTLYLRPDVRRCSPAALAGRGACA